MAGRVFKRCSRCQARVPDKVCAKCGGRRWTWTFAVDVERTADGRRRERWRSGFASKHEAQQAMRELLASVDQQRYVDPSRLTVAEYLEGEWLPAIAASVRPTTLAQYRQMVRVHIVPRLGSVHLQKLSSGHVNTLYSELLGSGGRAGTGLSPKTVRHVHVTLRKSLSDAVRWGRVVRNAAEHASPPRVERPQMRVWSVEQLRTFLEAVGEDRWAAGWYLLASTGMRRGELVGLRWDDIDLERGRVTVQRAVTTIDGRAVLTEPKTARGRRTLALDADSLGVLHAHRERQLCDARRIETQAPGAWRGEGWVLCAPLGERLHPEAVSRRFALIATKVGLPAIGVHGLRHSYATAALTAGIPAKVVSERLGHASVAVTLDVYSHVLPSLDEAAASAVMAHILGRHGTASGERAVEQP